MDMSIAIRIECAKGEIINAIQRIEQQNGLPPCILEGILSSVIAEVRAEKAIELINDTNKILREQNEELTKAKEAAKTVLKENSKQLAGSSDE